MIPRAEILRMAEEQGLLATTIEKDYVLGLKKCYFDTYRFSEDLDFTLPRSGPYDSAAIASSLPALVTAPPVWR